MRIKNMLFVGFTLALLMAMLLMFIYFQGRISELESQISDGDRTIQDSKQDNTSNDYKVTFKNITEETDKVTINIKYPQIDNYPDEKIQNKLNNYFEKTFTDLSDLALSDLETNYYDEQAVKNSYDLEMAVTLKKPSLISFNSSGYMYSGGAHGISVYANYTYDLKTGDPIIISDLFESNNYLEVLSDYCLNELRSREAIGDSLFEEGASPSIANFSEFFLDEDGLNIVFVDYQVAPYAAGPQTVHIPYSEIESVMNQDILAAIRD